MPSTALPDPGDEMDAEQVRDWVNNIISFLEGTNIDEANIDLSGTDGVVGKSTAQSITGLKSFESTSVAAGGVREVVQLGLDPASGTPAANDGGRLVMYADDAGGAESDIAYIDWVMTTATAGAEVGRLDFYVAAGAGSAVSQVQIRDGSVVPTTTDDISLGTTALNFSDLFLDSGAVIDFDSGDVTITHLANTLTIAGAATLVDIAAGIFELNNAVRFDTGVAIVATSYSVGRDADATNQLHYNVPTGATFEWSVNDVSEMTLSATALALGTNTVTAAALLANSNDSGAIGASGTAFSDLFLASGAVIDFAAGDVTQTHAANTMTWAGATSGYVFNNGFLEVASTVTGDATLVHRTIYANGTGSGTAITENPSAVRANLAAGYTGTNASLSIYAINATVSQGAAGYAAGVFGSSTGAGHTNIGGYFSATGATNNYGVYVAAGSIKNPVDSQGVYTGAGDDLRLMHDGTNSYIDNITGTLFIRPKTSESGVTLVPDGAVTLYYDNAAKLATKSGGVNVTGNVGASTHITATNGFYIATPDAEGEPTHIDDASNGASSTTLYIGNAAITVSSDERVKLDIEDFSGSALDLLAQARVVSFRYDPEAIHDESAYGPSSRGRYVGMIAQEMREWAPWAINAGDGTEREDFMWQAEYQHLVPLLVAAIQEQQAEIRQLKAKMN